MSIELTKEETENLLLVTLNYLQQNSNYLENGVGLKLLSQNTNIELNNIRKYIQEMKLQNIVSTRLNQTNAEEIYIYPTEQTIEKFDKLNTLTLSETAMILLKKTYDIYKRANFDCYFQFDSAFIGSLVGFTNDTKVRSAIEMLAENGLINNPAVMLDNIIYFISAKGISMIENGSDNYASQGNVVVNNIGGNVAVNSNNVKQSIITNELEEYFAIMEKLINENLSGEMKSNAINDLDTIRELSKVEQPKKHLIQKLLDNLDKIPILLEIANKIREFFI